MSKKRNKPYIPKRKTNPALFARQIEENGKKIEKLTSTFDHKYQALENFLSLLVNFASHDIKNAVHNLDGIVSTIDLKNFTQSDVDTMKFCLDNIRETLEKFTEFNITRKYNAFEISNLFQSLEILHRPYLKNDKIEFKVFYNGIEKNTPIKHDFQFLLYMFNNLMINSVTALKQSLSKKIHVDISSLDENSIVILFCDNGCGISPENKDKIFNPYFTTKEKGTGVGLTHVKYVLDEVKGQISYTGEAFKDLTTVFRIILPLKYYETSDFSN